MEDLKAAVRDHVDLVSELLEKLSGELRSGFGPAVDSFVGFFHAIDWKEPWLICLILFHVTLLLVVIVSRRNVNFQLCLSLLSFSGVYLAESINSFLAKKLEKLCRPELLRSSWSLHFGPLVWASTSTTDPYCGEHSRHIVPTYHKVEKGGTKAPSKAFS